MGEVIYFPTFSTATAIPAADDRLICDDVAMLTTICDDVETLLDMMVVIQRETEVVAWRLRTLAFCVCTI